MAAERSQLWEKAEACGEALRETAEIRAAMRVDPDLARFAGVVDAEARDLKDAQIVRLQDDTAEVAHLLAATEPRSPEIYRACARVSASAFRIAQDEAERTKARIAAKREAMLAAMKGSKA